MLDVASKVFFKDSNIFLRVLFVIGAVIAVVLAGAISVAIIVPAAAFATLIGLIAAGAAAVFVLILIPFVVILKLIRKE
ncbi:MAG: hypothetical protein PHI65_08085 [Firmicutes bacterium]|nr:hypothetical protein [Bacillota bacterium]